MHFFVTLISIYCRTQQPSLFSRLWNQYLEHLENPKTFYLKLFFSNIVLKVCCPKFFLCSALKSLCFSALTQSLINYHELKFIYLFKLLFTFDLHLLYRSSHRRCSIKKGVLKNFTKFTGNHMCQNLFFNKVADLRPATLLKKRLWHRCFPVNFVKFSRTLFLQNTSGRLHLV